MPEKPEIHHSETADHQIVVFGVPDEIEPLEDILRALPDIDVVTARQMVLSLPGLNPLRLAQETAADAAARIRQLGVGATAIPRADIPDFSHARPEHHVRVSGGELQVVDYRNDVQSWSMDQVAVVSVGVVPPDGTDHQRPPPTLAAASSHRVWNEGAEIAGRKRPEACVVLADGTVLHLASKEMNYEYLGNRRNTSSSANFAVLISDLVHAATTAWITPSTRAFLDHAPLRHLEFRTGSDFRHYTEFQALVSAQFRPFRSAESASATEQPR